MTAQTIESFAASIGAEIVDLDLTWESPRTETACNLYGGCRKHCTEFVPGDKIGRDTEPSCLTCTHSRQTHTLPTKTKKAKRS